MNKIITFSGVPGVRVIMKAPRCWKVQRCEPKISTKWVDIGPDFTTKDEAVDQAPYLCEF